MLLEISIFILSIACLLFALFSIPSLLQIRKTAETIAYTLQTLNQNLPAILKNLEEMTTQLNQTTLTIHRQIDGFSYHMKRLQHTLGFFADVVQILQGSIRLPFLNTLTNLTAMVRGFRVFLHVFNENRSSRFIQP
jgi:uncharacterized protein YoxC